MTVQRLATLQWFGLLAGPVAFVAAHVLGYGLTLAECNAGGGRWGVANDPWELALLSATALCATLAGAASLSIIVRTEGTSYEDDPPLSRIRFFAIAAVMTDVILVVIMLLDLFGNVFNAACRQA